MPEILCGLFCLFHCILALVQGKKIKDFCTNCSQPIFEGEKHYCYSLNDVQILCDAYCDRYLKYASSEKYSQPLVDRVFGYGLNLISVLVSANSDFCALDDCFGNSSSEATSSD
ncbi:hypothetical protein [Sigmofec virus UA08Rod_5614]|uniref:Uncharacterized protein n=1 Tax=Sigmofec virus UA08Rod_5614 TaxID=2929431 RepID=A0A976N0M8_9VIRU|nr:hypothetical protein [Sigmofec virus UA08Rod_5614]